MMKSVRTQTSNCVRRDCDPAHNPGIGVGLSISVEYVLRTDYHSRQSNALDGERTHPPIELELERSQTSLIMNCVQSHTSRIQR